jgi:hypothetical protein
MILVASQSPVQAMSTAMAGNPPAGLLASAMALRLTVLLLVLPATQSPVQVMLTAMVWMI